MAARKDRAAADKSTALRELTGAAGFDERRKMARLDIAIEVRYKVIGREHKLQGGVTRNISAGGCLFIASEKLSVGTELEIEMMLGTSPAESLKIKGRIERLTRVGEEMYESGIAFKALKREDRRIFADYVFSKMYEMIGLSKWPTDRSQKKQ